jgi:hypothetical protein
MKKIINSFTFLLIGYSCYAQVIFGVKSGINIATTKDIITFPKNRVGWYIGGRSHIPIHKKLFLQPELLFSSKGYRYIDLSDGKIVAMRLNYLTVPILLGYEIDHKTKFVLGAELGYLAKAINYFNKENIDATSSFPPRFDFGLDIGLAYNITKCFGAEIRYNYGFKGLYQTDILGNRRSEVKGANRVFQIGAYYFPSSK